MKREMTRRKLLMIVWYDLLNRTTMNNLYIQLRGVGWIDGSLDMKSSISFLSRATLKNLRPITLETASASFSQ